MSDQTNPFGDVSQAMAQFKLPGLDMAAIVEARRKDIEALTEANKAAFESIQALGKRQAEMLAEAMQEMQAAAKTMLGGGAMTDPAKQAELVRKGFEKTLADMKELADMARHAQSDVMSKITRRATQQMLDAKALIQPK